MARVVFVQTSWFEHQGVLVLAAVLTARGHHVDLLVARAPDGLVRELAPLRADLVAFPVTTGAHVLVGRLAAAVRQRLGVPVVAGGPHATACPDYVRTPGLDAVCVGEGELALQELAELAPELRAAGPRPVLKNIVWAGDAPNLAPELHPPLADLDALPLPDRGLYARYPSIARSPLRRFLTSRGCPYPCTYCHNATLRRLYPGEGSRVRRRSVGHVLAEIQRVRAQGTLRTVMFVDDLCFHDRAWTDLFVARYPAEVGLPFVADVRAERVTRELVTALRSAGCHSLRFGVESGAPRVRDEILGRHVTNERLLEAAALCHEAGIRVLTFNMVGVPGERLDDALATVDLNLAMGADFPRFSLFQPYPGTPLGDRVLATAGPDALAAFGETYFARAAAASGDHEAAQLATLQKLAWYAVRVPAVRRALPLLLRRTPPTLADALYLASAAVSYGGETRLGTLSAAREGLRHLALYLGGWMPRRSDE